MTLFDVKYKKLNRLKKFVFLLIFLPSFSLGQGRKYSNDFLSIGVDARALAMSNSVIASVNDIAAGYWNPAGLAGIQKSWQAAAMHTEHFASIAQYDYMAYAMPVDAVSVAGVSLIRSGVDDILDTTELIDKNGDIDHDRIRKFSEIDYALIGSYARKSQSISNFRYGGNVKIIYRQIGNFANSIGFGLDAGIQYFLKKWQFGATLRDVTSTFNAWSFNEDKLINVFQQTGNELPTENIELTFPRLLVGIGGSFSLGEKYSLHTEFNFDITFGGRHNTFVSSDFGNINPGFGFELGYRDFVLLRGGAGNIQRLRKLNGNVTYAVQPSLGLGFKYQGISMDYTLTDIADVSAVPYSNILSLKFNFADFKGL